MVQTRVRDTNDDITASYTRDMNGSKTTYTNIVGLHSEHMTGVDTPNFYHQRKKGHLLPMNSFAHFKVDGDGSWNNATAYRPGYYIEYSGHHAPWEDRWTLTFAELQNSAGSYSKYMDDFVNAAAAKIYASGHDTLTMLAELHKVARMFNNAVSTLANLLRGRSIAQAWLEYRYGWRLLWFDIVEIQKVLSQLDDKRNRFKETVGTPIDQSSDYEVVPYNWGTQQGIYRINNEITVAVRGSVIADINPPDFAFNPITTGWELVRFSFIVDWFIDIGSWLEALSFLFIADNHYAAGGIKITHRRIIDNHSFTPKAPYTSVSGVMMSDVYAEYTERVPRSVGRFPHPLINLNVYKVADLIALIFGGKPPRNSG